MHLGHRRSNSYSLPPAAGCNEDQSIIPPPPILSNRLNTAASERPKFATLQQFTRASGERRSFNSSQTTDTWSPVRNSSRSYKGVAISRATPALVRYNISPETDWIFDMNRPRSPSKVWKSGPVDAGVPSLDQALAAVKEQLVSPHTITYKLHTIIALTLPPCVRAWLILASSCELSLSH